MGQVRLKVKPGCKIRIPSEGGRILSSDRTMVIDTSDRFWFSYWKRRVKDGSVEVLPLSVVESAPKQDEPKPEERNSETEI